MIQLATAWAEGYQETERHGQREQWRNGDRFCRCKTIPRIFATHRAKLRKGKLKTKEITGRM